MAAATTVGSNRVSGAADADTDRSCGPCHACGVSLQPLTLPSDTLSREGGGHPAVAACAHDGGGAALAGRAGTHTRPSHPRVGAGSPVNA